MAINVLVGNFYEIPFHEEAEWATTILYPLLSYKLKSHWMFRPQRGFAGHMN